MTYRHFKYEGWLYALAFALALAVRLIALGALPLTDAEAAPALQALRLSQSTNPALDPHPLYILSTSILFFVNGGGTNFLARLIPALMGSLLVLAPLLFENRLKPRPSLVLAFFLALDPGLVAISRQAVSPILAMAFLAFTVGFFNKEKYNLAAICAALALLSGPSVWFGILILAITFAIGQIFKQKKEPREQGQVESDKSHATNGSPQPVPFNLQPTTFLSAFLLTFLLVGSLFFTAPAGLGAAFSSIPAFINKWTTTSLITPSLVFFSPLVYQPFALLLAMVALIRGTRYAQRRIIFLSLWQSISMALVIAMPARQMADTAWVLLPLNVLAAVQLVRHITVYEEERREVLGVAALTAFIGIFTWLGISMLNWLSVGSIDYNLQSALLVGSLLLLVVSLILIAAGWSIRVSSVGGVWGAAFSLGILTISGLFGSAGLRGENATDLWLQPDQPAQAALLRETVSQVSETGRGNDHTATIAILGFESPALEWALRENPIQLVNALDPLLSPDFVITSFEMNPELAAAYRGQDFIWRQNPSWHLTEPLLWLRWLTLREIPQTQEMIILWARSDLFLSD